jgi:hypothetical protein
VLKACCLPAGIIPADAGATARAKLWAELFSANVTGPQVRRALEPYVVIAHPRGMLAVAIAAAATAVCIEMPASMAGTRGKKVQRQEFAADIETPPDHELSRVQFAMLTADTKEKLEGAKKTLVHGLKVDGSAVIGFLAPSQVL